MHTGKGESLNNSILEAGGIKRERPKQGGDKKVEGEEEKKAAAPVST